MRRCIENFTLQDFCLLPDKFSVWVILQWCALQDNECTVIPLTDQAGVLVFKANQEPEMTYRVDIKVTDRESFEVINRTEHTFTAQNLKEAMKQVEMLCNRRRNEFIISLYADFAAVTDTPVIQGLLARAPSANPTEKSA